MNGAALLASLGGAGRRRLLVWPVRDQDRLARVVALLTALDGVDGVTIEDFDGHDLHVTAHVSGPVAASSELTDRLDRGIVSCAERAGRIELELSPRSSGRPVPGGPPPRPARRTARPAVVGPDGGDAGQPVPPRLAGFRVVGGAPTLTGTESPSARDGAAPLARPRAPLPTPVPRSVPGAPRRRWAPARTPPAADPLIDGAVRSIVGVSMLVCDADLRVRAITGPAYGRRPELGDPSPGRDVRDVLPPQTWETLAPGLAAALAGATEHVEFAGPPTGATYVATCAPVVDDGAVIGVTVVARDLAVVRGSDVELVAARDELDGVFDESPVRQALVSPDGRWVRVNPALCELVGLRPEELVGREVALLLHAEDRAGARGRFAALMADRLPASTARVRLVLRDGRELGVVLHLSVLRTAAGAARGVVLQVADGD